MGFAWGMVIGLVIGGSLGIIIIAIMTAASKADEKMGAD